MTNIKKNDENQIVCEISEDNKSNIIYDNNYLQIHYKRIDTNKSEIIIKIDNLKQNEYFSKFLHLSCTFEYFTGYSLNSNKLKIYGTPKYGKSTSMVKEIYENTSALIHIKKLCSNDNILRNNNILCMIIGDGKHPRAGILFALDTKWHVVSIDPIMDEKWVNRTQLCFINQQILKNLLCEQGRRYNIWY